MQIFRTQVGCAINTTSHIEGYHSSLKVHSNLNSNCQFALKMKLRYLQASETLLMGLLELTKFFIHGRHGIWSANRGSTAVVWTGLSTSCMSMSVWTTCASSR